MSDTTYANEALRFARAPFRATVRLDLTELEVIVRVTRAAGCATRVSRCGTYAVAPSGYRRGVVRDTGVPIRAPVAEARPSGTAVRAAMMPATARLAASISRR